LRQPSISILAVAAFSLAALRAFPASPAAELRPEPVHPWAWERTERGGTADVFVVLREQADLSGADRLKSKAEKGWFVFDALRSVSERSRAPLLRRLREAGVEAHPFWIVNAIHVPAADRPLLVELASRPDVARIDGNPTVRLRMPEPESAPARPTAGMQPAAIEWNVTKVKADQVWSTGHQGEGVVVGGQDTGYRWTHSFLKSKYRGWDGTTASHDYNWHDSVHGSPSNPCGSDIPAPCDDHGHGTHTMGTVLGDDGAGHVYGVAPSAKWIGCRDMDQGNGTPATYLECFQFFLAPTKVDGSAPDPSKAPDVTSNSWGCPASEGCAWDTLLAAAAAQRSAGILTVAAAGNSGSSCGSVNDPPAMYPTIFTVGSTTSTDAMSSFSSRGPGDGNALMKPDVVAPGSGVLSSSNGSDTATATLSGTSMATPAVAGGVALFWSARPEFKGDLDGTIAQLECKARRLTAIVESCGGDYVNGPNNTWGYGLLDLEGAVDAALAAPATLSADPNGDNRIDLSWGAVAGAGSYEVFRGTATGGPYQLLQSVTAPSTTWSDIGVSGGATWHYVVRGVAGCRSPFSPEASATATGPCSLAPTFAGLASVSDAGAATCTLDLAWAPATAGCGGAPVSYDLFRSPLATFTPAPANRIATRIAGTSYSDDVGLSTGGVSYYVVRAVDGISGVADSNLVRVAGSPTGPATLGTWSAGAEAGGPTMTLEGSWGTSTAVKRSGSASWFSAYPSSACQALVTPTIVLGSGSVLSWYFVHSIESGYDGARVEATIDGGATWSPLTPTPNYGSSISYSGNGCGWATSTAVWSGNSAGFPTTWQGASVTLPAGYDGKSARFRWRFSSDSSVAGSLANPGLYVDDISVTNALVGGACATGSAARPVPDGKFVSGAGMTAREGGDGLVTVAWDVSACTSPDFNLYFGAIGDFGLAVAGRCALGAGGAASGLSVGGDRWWVVAGAAGSEVGSFGRRSTGAERPLSGWSGVCSQSAQALTAHCP
jgi:subtilisin family serine protease